MKTKKRCSKCKQSKAISEFNKNRSNKDGLQSCCKSCKKMIDSNYHKTEKGKAVTRKATKKHQKTTKRKATKKHFYDYHPNQIKATTAVNHAIEAGKLPQPNFLQCHYGEHPAHQYHHHNGYEPKHWLDVIPVCKKCHRKCHMKGKLCQK